MNVIEKLINWGSENQSPHWAVQVFLGILVTIIVRDCFPAIWKYAKNIKFYDPILGDWHVKHVTFDKAGNLKILDSECYFSRSIDGDVIKVKTTSSGKESFNGNTKRSSGNYHVYLYGKQKEEKQFNLCKVFPQDTNTVGIWTGVDYRNNIIAAPVFFSKDPISDKEFTDVIRSHFNCSLEDIVISYSPSDKRNLEHAVVGQMSQSQS